MRIAFRDRGDRRYDTRRDTLPGDLDRAFHGDLRGRGSRLEPAHLTLRTEPHPFG